MEKTTVGTVISVKKPMVAEGQYEASKDARS